MNSRSSSSGWNLKSLLISKNRLDNVEIQTGEFTSEMRNQQIRQTWSLQRPCLRLCASWGFPKTTSNLGKPWFFIKMSIFNDIHVLKIIFIRTKSKISTDLDTTDLTTSKFKLLSLAAKCATRRFGRHDHSNVRVFDFVPLEGPQKTYQTLVARKWLHVGRITETLRTCVRRILEMLSSL